VWRARTVPRPGARSRAAHQSRWSARRRRARRLRPYACKASADLFGLAKSDLIDQVKEIITVGEFYDLAAGGQVIFT
jgi:peroxiredoxin family protein